MRFSVLCCVENIKVAFCFFFAHTRLFVIVNFALTNKLFSRVFYFPCIIIQIFISISYYTYFVCEKTDIFWHITTNKKINNFSKKHDKRIVFNKRVYHFVWYGKYLNCSAFSLVSFSFIYLWNFVNFRKLFLRHHNRFQYACYRNCFHFCSVLNSTQF